MPVWLQFWKVRDTASNAETVVGMWLGWCQVSPVHCKEVLRVGTLTTALSPGLPGCNQRLAGPTFLCGKGSQG